MTSHTGRPLPGSTPAAEGVDTQGVHAFLDALEAAPDVAPHGLMLLRHGRVVAEGWWGPYTPERPQLLYSLSKSFTSTAAGLAAAEGLIDLDDTVVSYFPEFEQDVTDPRSRAIRLRHVAAMASGHLTDMAAQADARDHREWVRGLLMLPPDREPGTVFAYNQPATYSLGAIVQRVTGQTLTEYLRPRLFEPLGIGDTFWQQHPKGRDLAFSGLHATTDAVARLGLLYLRGGVWEGRRLLPAAWVAEATTPQVANADGTPEGAESDWQQGYGFQFWMSRHGYRGDGAYGQYCVVLPEQDVVLALTSETGDMQAVLEMVWRHLLPACGEAPLEGREDADAALRLRLSRLVLPQVAGKPAPPDGPDGWSGARFAPEGGACEDQPTLTGVTVAADDGGWALSLAEDHGEPLVVRFDGAGWSVAEGGPAAPPTAVSAGWTDPDTLVAEVAFLETPHRLDLTCGLAAGTFTARWRTKPLTPGRLGSYRAPRG
jgi:CubicO group peptidase (beta-lactamase class C family)